MLLRDVARARDRSVAARAFLYIGYCQEKRRTGEASGTYRSILAEFPEQREAVYEARRRLSLLGHAAASNGVATSVQSTWIPTAVARISVGGIPQRVAITPGGDEVYVTSLESNTVSVFETTTYKVTSTIAVHGQPGPIVVAQDGLHVYVGHGDGGITVIDARTKFARWVDVGNGPVRDLALTRDGRSLYIAAEHSGLLRLKLATDTAHTVSPTRCPMGLALTPDGRTLYVNYQCKGPGGQLGRDAIGRFDSLTGEFLGSLTGFPNVGGDIRISEDGSRIWASGDGACLGREFDVVGCPMVPSHVVNVFRAADHTLIRTIGIRICLPG